MYYVYILKSLKDLRTYVGFTSNFDNRFKQHNAGRVQSTKNRRPFTLLNLERFTSRQEAKRREQYWKSGVGRKRMRNFFNKQDCPKK